MSPVSRRISLYWVLLLVPTLVVGAAAIYLVRREQARVIEQGSQADEARRAAVAARARLIVENVELLAGDVQTGLLDALAEAPAPTLDRYLDEWERTNPLVRTTFRATDDGRLLRPAGNNLDEDARGFVRRFSAAFRDAPPWRDAKRTPSAPAAAEPKFQTSEQEARKGVGANVANMQSARRDVQELFKAQEQPAPSGVASPDTALADVATEQSTGVKAKQAKAESDSQPRVASAPASARSSSAAGTADTRRAEKVTAAAPALARVQTAKPERRGWWSHAAEGRQHVLGWLQLTGGEVRGVEVETAALISRLGGSLPADTPLGEGFALRDSAGRIVHQSGAVPMGGEPLLRVPLATAMLPGWDVVAFLDLGRGADNPGSALMGIGVLLVAIFVAAILAGGSLLLRQARLSEEEAAQKTSFVANVSHEFKTPLTTIRLYSELLEQGRVRDAAQGNEYLRTIGRETQRLARLVNNALDFSRLEQGRKKYAPETIELKSEVSRLLDTHEPRIRDAGLTLQRELPETAVTISTDRDALEQILLNLIDNACKYAAEGGELTVTVTKQEAGRGVEVRIGDRGPGVPASQAERIFEKFHRVDDSLTAEKTGAGLGLTIARQLARGLGGDVRYTPRPGGGAEFILSLP